MSSYDQLPIELKENTMLQEFRVFRNYYNILFCN